MSLILKKVAIRGTTVGKSVRMPWCTVRAQTYAVFFFSKDVRLPAGLQHSLAVEAEAQRQAKVRVSHS